MDLAECTPYCDIDVSSQAAVICAVGVRLQAHEAIEEVGQRSTWDYRFPDQTWPGARAVVRKSSTKANSLSGSASSPACPDTATMLTSQAVSKSAQACRFMAASSVSSRVWVFYLAAHRCVGPWHRARQDHSPKSGAGAHRTNTACTTARPSSTARAAARPTCTSILGVADGSIEHSPGMLPDPVRHAALAFWFHLLLLLKGSPLGLLSFGLILPQEEDNFEAAPKTGGGRKHTQWTSIEHRQHKYTHMAGGGAVALVVMLSASQARGIDFES